MAQISRPIPARRSVPLLTARCLPPGRMTGTAGQEIALVGATGKATGPHLHFELMHDGYYCNPEFYLAAV